jgi:protein SCO1/2
MVSSGGAAPALPASTSSAQAAGHHVAVPAIKLVRDDGRHVDFRAELDDGRPVYLNFIFTSCQGICPASSQVFAQLQRRLGKAGSRAHLVSVSLDPDYDTPARLREYAARFHAGKAWQHYTGTVADSVAVQKAFGAWRGDKMNHEPVTFFRLRPGSPWERIDGFATAADLHGRLPQP